MDVGTGTSASGASQAAPDGVKRRTQFVAFEMVAVGSGLLRPHARHLASQRLPTGTRARRPTYGRRSALRLPTRSSLGSGIWGGRMFLFCSYGKPEAMGASILGWSTRRPGRGEPHGLRAALALAA